MQTITNQAIKGIHSQTLIVIIKGIQSLIYFAIMSRLLSPDDFGYFALLTAVTTILSSLSEAGLGSSIIQKKNANKDFTSTAFTLSLLLGLFFSIILLILAKPLSYLLCDTEILTKAFRIMSSIIFIQAVNNITWALYMKKLDFFKFGILQAIADFLSYLVGIYFAYNGYGFYAIIYAVVANQVFLTIILIFLKKYDFKIIIVKSYVKDIIGYGGWLTATVIIRNLTNEIDKVIIGKMLPILDLGAINRPQGFVSRISTQVNGIFDTVLFPILSSIQEDREKISRAYIKIVTLVVGLSLILASILSLSSKIIINIFFGSQWIYLESLLILFSFALIVHGYSRIADSFFRSLGIVKDYFYARLINWGIFILAVWIGCRFGIIGAAIGMVIGSTMSCVIKYFMQKNKVKVKLMPLIKSILQNTTCIIIILIISWIIKVNIPYGDYLGIGCFLISLLILAITFPKLFGHIFQTIIIERYKTQLKKIVHLSK